MVEFPEWLAENARSGKGGIVLDAASRGRAHKIVFNMPAAYADATLRGEVRASPDAGTALATFTVTGPVVAGDYAVFTATLAAGTGANSTGILPADGDGDGVVSFPVDFLITPDGGTEELLLSAELPVTGRITV